MPAPSKFYVYIHYASGWSGPFYIGKGKGHRAWCSDKRSPHWQSVACEGFEPVVVKDGMSEPCAYTLEKIMISFWGLDWLTNKSKGGGAPYGVIQSEEANEKRRMAMLGDKNHNYGKPLPPHVLEAAKRHNLGKRHTIETKKKKSIKVSGKNHPQLDRIERRFIHDDGTLFVGLRFDFIKQFELSPSKVCNLISGSRAYHKGWKLS